MNLANEGLEARKKDDELAAKKRKAEDDKLWEGSCTFHLSSGPFTIAVTETREQRVGSWRTFTQNGKKKKKTKGAVLG